MNREQFHYVAEYLIILIKLDMFSEKDVEDIARMIWKMPITSTNLHIDWGSMWTKINS